MDVLSARLRTWLLLAVALPAARMLVRRAADRARRRPDSATTTWLRHVAAQRQHRSVTALRRARGNGTWTARGGDRRGRLHR